MTIRTGAAEAHAPKYSHIERERRWLVDLDRLPPLAADYVRIEDRYLHATRFRLRRMTDSASGETSLKLAKKYETADPAARPMVNAYLTEAEFAIFAALPAQTIDKRRHVLDGFSVDVFAGPLDGLILAECEASNAKALARLIAPVWAAREVTDDTRFQGGALAQLDAIGLAELLRA